MQKKERERERKRDHKSAYVLRLITLGTPMAVFRFFFSFFYSSCNRLKEMRKQVI